MLGKLYRPVKGERTKDWRLTQKRGERPEYYKKLWRPMGHAGLDYAGAIPWQKIPIYASHPWTAKVLIDKWWFGNYVVIEANGYSTYYAHLDSVSVKSWDRVMLNQQVGIMGTTGNSTGIHLHFGLKVNGKRTDPTPYIKDWDKPIDKPIDKQPIQETNEDTKYLLQLQEDKIRNGEIGNLDQRMLVIVARIYNKLRK